MSAQPLLRAENLDPKVAQLLAELQAKALQLQQLDPEMFGRLVTSLEYMLIDDSDEGYALWKAAALSYTLAEPDE